MSDWTDDDGESLGDWVSITCDDRDAFVKASGGMDHFTVAAAFTDVEIGHVYTEWARPDADVPEFRDDIWRGRIEYDGGYVSYPNARYPEGKCTHARFVPTERAS